MAIKLGGLLQYKWEAMRTTDTFCQSQRSWELHQGFCHPVTSSRLHSAGWGWLWQRGHISYWKDTAEDMDIGHAATIRTRHSVFMTAPRRECHQSSVRTYCVRKHHEGWEIVRIMARTVSCGSLTQNYLSISSTEQISWGMGPSRIIIRSLFRVEQSNYWWRRSNSPCKNWTWTIISAIKVTIFIAKTLAILTLAY